MNKTLLLLIGLFILIIIVIAGVVIYNPRVNKSDIVNQPITQVTPKPLSLTPSTNPKPEIPNYDHIIVIIMENKTTGDILGNSKAPFINSLAKQNALASDYSAVSNPSLPNYLAIIGGDTFGITSDCTNCFISSNSIVEQLEQNHKSWKAYMESMPSSCFLGSSDLYAQKHNPFIYFNNIRNNPDRCENIVPFDQFPKDLTDSSGMANFIWITPNLCNDMHDCSISKGDNWLSEQIPSILNSYFFKSQKSLLILTFDEGESSNNKVTTILVGADVKKGFNSNNPYTHYSLLKTIEESWNLAPLTANDQNAKPMSDFFD